MANPSATRTAREFERWFDANHAAWPADLKVSGHRALFALKRLDRPAAELVPAVLKDCASDIGNFYEAYAAHIARAA